MSQPLIGWAAAINHERRQSEALRRLDDAAARTPSSTNDWIDLAADLANSGLSMWQLRMMIGAMYATRKDQPND